MAALASPPVAREAWVRDTALRLVGGLAACDERVLLARARDDRRDPRCLHGPLSARLPLAVTLALLRPLRLLGVTGSGVRFVGELPFAQIDTAVAACVDLAREGDVNGARSVRAWVARQRLGPWTTHESTWCQRLDRARGQVRAIAAEVAFAACRGRTVVAARPAQLPTGPLDGADGMELIFENGMVVVAAVGATGAHAFLLGAQPALRQLHAQPTWLFRTPSGSCVPLELAGPHGVVVQPSPLDV